MGLVTRRVAALPFLVLLLAAATGARAGALYRCDAADGSVAYTSSREGYTNCVVVQVFADPPRPAAAVVPKAAPASQSPVVRQGWVYEENVPAPADFAGVRAGVSAEPATMLRADFRGVYGAAASTARVIEFEDFSTVLADVTSSAPTIGNPLFIAAPYRPRSQARIPAAAPVATVAARPAAAPAKARTVRGAVYKVARKDGILEYTNVKPRGGSFAVLFTYIATCFAFEVHSGVDFARTALNLEAYRAEIAAAAAEFGVDVALLRAVIHAESAFNPMALSRKGAQGLMQLMPGTAVDLGVIDAFDAAENIRGGARYLAQLLRSFNGDSRLATAAYNAGPGAVQKYGGIPPYDETQVYVERVATLRDRYAKAL